MEKVPVLEMIQVRKAFVATLAVDNVDFTVYPGEVHALCGENGAGKSTLMKMLAGSFNDYTGEIKISGEPVNLHSPGDSIKKGIGMVYQELSLARPISIAENVLVGRLPVKNRLFLDKKTMIDKTRSILSKVGLEHLDPRIPISEISQHEAQLVEISKVMSNDPKILVMDEPTSALSRDEVELLFQLIDKLKKSGMAIIYISHHLPEVFRVADRVTVMRDGKRVDTKPVDAVTTADLVHMMVGESIDEFYAKRKGTAEEEVMLEVDHAVRYGFFHDISFQAKKGEILGIVGLAGAGRTELGRSICGIDPLDEGIVRIHGKNLKTGSYPRTIKSGMAYLTEDRKNDGLFLRLPAGENLYSSVIYEHCSLGIFSKSSTNSLVQYLVEKLNVVPPDVKQEVNSFSGGNQQKILLGKCLAMDPEVLILDEPTRGVDVGAKATIHDVVLELADKGMTIVLMSSDLPELVGLADRVIVMRHGHLIGEMYKEQLTEETALLAANGEGDVCDVCYTQY